MDAALRVFRAACGPSHAFLSPKFIEKTAQRMSSSLLELQTDVLDDGEVRGFVSRNQFFVDALFIDPPHQCQGLGKRLLDHLKTQMKVIQLSVFGQNLRAIRFYQREEFWAVKINEHRETGETVVLLKWEAKKNDVRQ